MIKIIDEQLTMTEIPMGINEQEEEKGDASLRTRTHGNYEMSLLLSLLLNKKRRKHDS
jgi:hypothetical protein